MTEIALGLTLRCNAPPRHIWIVLTKPCDHDGKLLMVNLTTLRDSCVDDACILDPSDYPGYLTHSTTVAYSRSIEGDASMLSSAIGVGSFVELDPIPEETLAKIIEGCHNSPEMSPAKRRLVSELPE